MSDRDEQFKKGVREFFESLALRVADIPRADEKTPDLLIEEGTGDATLIELKQKSHDQKELDTYLQQTDSAGIASRSRSTGHRNRLDGIVASGVQQLTAKDPSRSYFHILWFHCEGYDADLHELQLRATVYGTQKLISTAHSNVITCYYFWNSSFFRHRLQLDAIMLSRGDEAQMLLNDHSPRFDAIKQSKLFLALGSAVFFPQQYQLSDNTMVCTHTNPRDSESFTLDYLRTKYGLPHLQTINMRRHDGRFCCANQDLTMRYSQPLAAMDQG
jgi:hypothetical protein